jgi:hypothetical protein
MNMLRQQINKVVIPVKTGIHPAEGGTGSRIESGMTTKNKYPKAVFDFVFVLNKPEIESN